jgi:hypothetical protein
MENGIMTQEQWLTLIGILTGLAIGILNFYNGSVRGKSIGMLEQGTYLESVNKSVDLANKRALEAEVRAISAEDRATALGKRMTSLEKSLSYRLTFDVVLGSNPMIEHVEIQHYPENRKVGRVYTGEEKRKN